jgi:pyruvate dehydrogenase E1 component alpha subunit
MTLALSRDAALERLRQMLLIRRFEERAAELYSAGKIRGFLHLYIGEEAIAVGALSALSPDDNVVASYREHGQALLRGVSAGALMAEMFGKENGCARGRGGSMHLFDAAHRFFGGHGIVGAGLPVAVGLALADKLLARSAVTACFFGDGAAEEGEFPESLNLAALWRVPVLFLCENNGYAMGTALERHAAKTELAARAVAYGVPAERVDGMDVAAVERAVRYAAELVREERAPRMLELISYRFRAHSMYDADKYRSKEELAAWRRRDPVESYAARLVGLGYLDDAKRKECEAEIASLLERAVEEAEAGGLESIEQLERNVYARPLP